MKVIGLLGGMSWESSAEYYRYINQIVQQRLGGLHSARSLMLSVDFSEIEILQQRGDWSAAGALLGEAALQLERGGAECIVLCTNTMHRVADQIEEAVSIPLLHIADATAECAKAQGCSRLGLLGTRFTMEESFYRGRLHDQHGVEVLIPEADDRLLVHEVIYEELCRGIISERSQQAYIVVMDKLIERGAQGIVLGCTEIGLLVTPEMVEYRLFDTTQIHAAAAVEFALASG